MRKNSFEEWTNNKGLRLYVLYSDELRQYTYTLFNEITGTVQTLYNKEAVKELYYV